ncbi:DUF3267 domain-containing protein [Chloroflexota bacterium]
MSDAEINTTDALQKSVTAPAGYTLAHRFILTAKRTLLWMNVIGVVLFLFALGVVFWALLFYQWLGSPLVIQRLPAELPIWVYFLLIVGTLALHELLHGIPIWRYGKTPHFGIKVSKLVLFTTSDDFFTHHEYLVVTVTPLLAISVVGLVVMLLVPINIALWVGIMVAMNFASSIGDMWMAAVIASFARVALFHDEEDGMSVFLPDDQLSEIANANG